MDQGYDEEILVINQKNNMSKLPLLNKRSFYTSLRYSSAPYKQDNESEVIYLKRVLNTFELARLTHVFYAKMNNLMLYFSYKDEINVKDNQKVSVFKSDYSRLPEIKLEMQLRTHLFYAQYLGYLDNNERFNYRDIKKFNPNYILFTDDENFSLEDLAKNRDSLIKVF